MQILDRVSNSLIEKRMAANPVVALLGPRQCGKSTTAKEYLKGIDNYIYLDLEKLTDLAKLNDIWAFFNANLDKVICLDEIQNKPDIFSQIRSYVDENPKNGRFLVLGSASRDLINQSSETLAGRISYIEMGPFELREVQDKYSLTDLWLKGGFPRSLLSIDLEESNNWRENYIRTFLERDLPALGFKIPSPTLSRFWQMCAHIQGQLLNASKLGTSLGVSNHTIMNYLEILEETFVIRLLRPYHKNIKKRLVKSPKVYIRDSGIVHSLLSIEEFNDLLGHPVYGFSFEGFIIENLIKLFPKHQPYFYRTAIGDELDLLLIKGTEKLAFEIKASTAPEVEDGFWKVLKDLRPTKTFIIANVDSNFTIKDGIEVVNLEYMISYVKDKDRTN